MARVFRAPFSGNDSTAVRLFYLELYVTGPTPGGLDWELKVVSPSNNTRSPFGTFSWNVNIGGTTKSGSKSYAFSAGANDFTIATGTASTTATSITASGSAAGGGTIKSASGSGTYSNPPAAPTTFKIPNYFGEFYTAAQADWEASSNPNWTGEFTAKAGDTTPLESNNNKVYSQSPLAGSMQAASSSMTVNYYVYVKPVIMPNLNDRTEENATSALTTSGFTSTPTITRTTVGATSDNVGKVVKDSQSPAALTSTTAGQAISFSVYQLPGKRILGSSGNNTELKHAKRYAPATETESSGWKNITTFKRYNGSTWIDITN